MVKNIKIFFFVFSLGILLFPNVEFSTKNFSSHEVCCCAENTEHQAKEKECCGTHCKDCFSHSHRISVFYARYEDFLTEKLIIKNQKISSYRYFSLPKFSHNIWQPPKIA